MDAKEKRGQILRDLRIKKGLKQTEIAEILGITQQAYQRYEYGTSEPNADGFLFLADFYGVTTDYLLGREPLVNPFDMLSIDTASKSTMEMFAALPEVTRKIILEAMVKLADAAREQENELTISTECGAIEDAAREKDGISAW